ncbi:MAG: hypothetical protein KKB19_00340, partial [Bacteroidetes bacterium]|nr:hypothetical protein [Bacteroidota bacterium]
MADALLFELHLENKNIVSAKKKNIEILISPFFERNSCIVLVFKTMLNINIDMSTVLYFRYF